VSTDLNKQELTTAIRKASAESGFAQTGIAPSVTPTGYHHLLEWLASGYAGDMQWIERRKNAYQSPAGVMPGTRSVIVAAMNYHTGQPPGGDARVSRYAWGENDYHQVLRDKLRNVAETLHSLAPQARTRVVVDTAPLLERDFARLAGLGWLGKNTMLISRTIGSWFFLGALLTDVELDYDDPEDDTWCGTCTRCLDACPTDAFPEPGVLDARRCISYLTIELRQSPIPRELRSGVQDWVFGCDICQEVCPWNRFAPRDVVPELQPSSLIHPIDARHLLRMSETEFRERFGDTPLARPGYSGMRRNAAIVLGNLCDLDAEPELTDAIDDNDAMVRGAAAWALGQLKSPAARDTLQRQYKRESDPSVREEIEDALQQSGSNPQSRQSSSESNSQNDNFDADPSED